MKILGTICARAGSKGLKNKNLKELMGKPLIAHTIEHLKQWGKAGKIVCSTDSEEIAKVAREYGAETPFIRPADLASDTAAKIGVLKHAVKECEKVYGTKYDVVVDLDPTAPLRKVEDIEGCYRKLVESDANAVLSACHAIKNPYFNMFELDEKGYAHLCKESNVTRRQDAPKVFEANASIYAYRRNFLLETGNLFSEKTLLYKMPESTASHIDSETDFLIVKTLMEHGGY